MYMASRGVLIIGLANMSTTNMLILLYQISAANPGELIIVHFM